MSLSILNSPLLQQVNSEVSWRLTVDLDKQQQLFYGKLSTNYVVDAFVCSCGHTEFAIRGKDQSIPYACPECENKHFYDANLVWQNYHSFISNNDLELSFEYRMIHQKNGVGINYVLPIPQSINMMNNSVKFEYKEIYAIFITTDGEMTKEYETAINLGIFKVMEEKLVRYVEKYQYFDIAYDKSKKLTLSKILFFLKHKYLKSPDYYYWKEVDDLLPDVGETYDIHQGLAQISNHRKERLVKKFVYTEYLRQLKVEGSFHPGYINVLCKSITDPNILVKFLSLPSLRYLDQQWIELEILIVFLKTYYSEKQIAKLFEINVREDRALYMLRDTFNMLMYDGDMISVHFQKVRCTMTALHNEFSRCQTQNQLEQIDEYVFVYTEEELERCIYLNGYKVQLPQSNIELFNWGETLHNCLLNYETPVKKRLSIIYGFYRDNELIFAVEIKNNRIVQASSKYNSELDIEEKFVLYEWFGRFFK